MQRGPIRLAFARQSSLFAHAQPHPLEQTLEERVARGKRARQETRVRNSERRNEREGESGQGKEGVREGVGLLI